MMAKLQFLVVIYKQSLANKAFFSLGLEQLDASFSKTLPWLKNFHTFFYHSVQEITKSFTDGLRNFIASQNLLD